MLTWGVITAQTPDVEPQRRWNDGPDSLLQTIIGGITSGLTAAARQGAV